MCITFMATSAEALAADSSQITWALKTSADSTESEGSETEAKKRVHRVGGKKEKKGKTKQAVWRSPKMCGVQLQAQKGHLKKDIPHGLNPATSFWWVGLVLSLQGKLAGTICLGPPQKGHTHLEPQPRAPGFSSHTVTTINTMVGLLKPPYPKEFHHLNSVNCSFCVVSLRNPQTGSFKKTYHVIPQKTQG